jgi:signal transduction histidine kinase
MSEDTRLPTERGERSFRPRLRRRTIRARLAVLFFAVFLASGALLLAVTVAVWQSRTVNVTTTAVPTGRLQNPATGITQHSSDRHELLIAAAIAFAIMALVSLAIGWLVAGRFLRPLRTITTTTREISANNLHERLNLSGPDDELTELADTIDQLLDRLERSFAFERQFVANASHELRTPLAGMRTSLDVAMAKPGPVPGHIDTLAYRLRRELDQVDRLLESFLTLARSQQGAAPTDLSTLSLADLARLAIERRADAITEKGLEVEQRLHPDAWVNGSATLLARMVGNVIDNSIGHNEQGGWARVTTAAVNNSAQLVVANGGPALNSNQVTQLTKPFQRGVAERTGSDNGAGLGLAIVASIVEVHGGTLNLEALADGGLCLTINLPLAPPAAAEAPV